jgi:hypothetical protein
MFHRTTPLHFGAALRRTVAVAALALTAALLADPGGGSTTGGTPGGPIAANLALSDVWRLEAGTVYHPGGASTIDSTRFRGTMNLVLLPTMQPGIYPRTYQVSDVNWLVTVGGQEVYVSGGGTYQLTAGSGATTALSQSMSLQLKWGADSPVRSFVGGPTPLVGVAGRSMDITLHEVFTAGGGGTPSTATIHLKTAALPVRSITPYTAPRTENQFLQGCYAPCDCPLMMTPMQGRFGLVDLPVPTAAMTGHEFALVHMNFSTASPTATPTPGRLFHGAGVLQWIPSASANAGATQRLRADLADSGAAPGTTQRFDSGNTPWSPSWPNISISIADHNFYCYNRVLEIMAHPATATITPPPSPTPTPTPTPGGKP